jgi:arabinofuranosyltransferase
MNVWSRPRWLPVLACAFVVASFSFNVHQHFALNDDAFISFRYSKHLVEGLGLVWNVGERVEGYSNPLWVVIAAAGMAAGFEPEILMPALGIVSAALVLVLLVALGWRRWGRQSLLPWLAPAALATSRSYTTWAGAGLETHFFALLVLAGLLVFLRERRVALRWPWFSSLLLALASLTRPDGGVFMFGAGLCFLVDTLRGRRLLSSLVVWCLPWLALVGAHFLWRHSYFGYWLPNTYYAKVNGPWWDQGAIYLDLFLSEYSLYAFLPLVLLSVVKRRDALSTLLLLCTVLYASSLARVGGGHLEFRLLVPLFPLLYWLIADGIAVFAEARPANASARWSCIAGAIVFSSSLLAATVAGSLNPLDRSGTNGIGGTSTGFTQIRMTQGKALRQLIDLKILPTDLRIETGAVGALPYYTDWYVLDKRGLNDIRVAREPLTRRGRVGHEHEATLAYVRERNIAVFNLGPEIILDGSASTLIEQLRWAHQHVRHYNRRARTPAERLRLKCLQIPGPYRLLFGTNLDEEEFQSVLGHLENCPVPRQGSR